MRAGVLLLCLSALLSLTIPAACAADSGGYRGPMNNGIFPASGLLRQWPEDGPKLVWKAKLGEGWASCAVADGKVYVAGGLSGLLYVFDGDGNSLQKIPFGSAIWKRFSGTRGVPLVKDGIAVVQTPSANVIGLDLATEEPRWSINAWKSFGSGKGDQGWGYPETPVLAGDNVIVNCCSRDKVTPVCAAVDIHTGKTVWEMLPVADVNYSAGDGSGSYFRHNGRDMAVICGWRSITCLDPHSGKRFWEMTCSGGGENNLTPVYNEGYLLVRWMDKMHCLELSPDGSAYKILWKRPYGGFAHAVILNGRVYMFGGAADPWSCPSDDGAKPLPPAAPAPKASNPRSILCIDVKSGKVLQSRPRSAGDGHIVSADGLIFMQEGLGKALKLTLLRPTEKGFDAGGEFTLRPTADDLSEMKEYECKECVNPVISNGRLYVRYGTLYVYDIRVEQPSYGFRADGQGHVDNVKPPVKWHRPDNVQWSASVGAGPSSPVSAAGKVFVTAGADDLVCLEAATGKELWRRANPVKDAGGEPPAVAPQAPGTTEPTPIVRENRVYAAFGTGVVACYDLDGKRQWVSPVLPPEASALGASPLLSEDTLIVQGAKLVGLDIAKGEVKWHTPVPTGARYGPPAKARIGDTNVVLTGWGALLRASDGTELLKGFPDLALASPTVADGVAYYAGVKKEGGAYITAAYRLPGDIAKLDESVLKPLWREESPAADAGGASPLVVDNLLYVIAGEELVVRDAATGKVVTRKALGKGCGNGRMTFAGGRIYLAGANVTPTAESTSLPGQAHYLASTLILQPGAELKEVWSYQVHDGVGDPAFVADRQFVRAGAKLYGIGGTTPVAPVTPPFTVVKPVTAALPAGVVAGPFTNDVAPTAWVFCGPIPGRNLDTDYLKALGGREKALPAAGTEVAPKLTFGPLLPNHWFEHGRFTNGMPSIDITEAFHREAQTTGYFFTVMDNDAPRYVRYRFLTPDGISWNSSLILTGKSWLAGTPLNKDDMFLLEKGRYPLMVQVTIGKTDSWGHIWMCPRLADVGAEYNRTRKTFETVSAYWQGYTEALKQPFVLE